MIVPLLLAVAAPADAAVDALLEHARRATSAAVQCTGESREGEVVVCGRRRAATYRLPLVGGDGGTPLDPTPAARTAMLTPPSKCEEKSPFLVGCGSFGVHAGISSDGKARLLKPRELTP